jgi:hypothetical protein
MNVDVQAVHVDLRKGNLGHERPSTEYDVA